MATYDLSKVPTKELLLRIVDEMQGLVIADAEGRYVYVNQHWSVLTGYSLEDVRGRFVRDVVRSSRVDEVLRTKKMITGDAVLLNATTGREVPVYCSYAPLFENDELAGCFLYMIPKNERESPSIPTNVTALLDELNQQLLRLQKTPQGAMDSIVGSSPQILKMKHEIAIAARSMSTVLIEGETGCGKELVAHAIHELSDRSDQRMIKVNCAAIPSELLEAEFFGYTEGAFTGAKRGGKPGKFELADKGTLFLDEINQMPLSLQPKLLRALQEREIERVGSPVSIPIDTRVISATNVSLEDLVRQDLFRSDLYFRLNVIRISIPPLRERKEDIPELIDFFMKQLNLRLNLQIPGITPDAVERLMEYDWPGNVRELQNVLERAMNLAWFETLEWKYFSDYFLHHSLASSAPVLRPTDVPQPTISPLRRYRGEAERELLRSTLAECGGNKAEAARKLGLSRTALYKKLHNYHLL
ncbi:MAG: sigma 54-interacting transcriptional regulator [Oscillibacter sp.]|nr:sigma 54-interacting transcriptional regulator [Oscillibacter sp.]